MKILENYKLKIVGLIFAILIWFFVVTENNYEHVLEIPITPVNFDEGKVIVNEFPSKARIKVKGSGKSLIALGVSRGARVELDLSGVDDKRTFYLGPRHVFLRRPAGTITPTEILMPDSVTILLDTFTIKRVPVNAKVAPSPAAGYTVVGHVQINPDSVIVSGPKSILEQIREVHTVTADYSDLTFDFKETLALAPLPYPKVSTNESSVEVFQDIQTLVEVTLKGVPVEVRNVPRNMRVNVRPSTLTLTLEGGGDLLAQLNRNEIIAYIDYNRARSQPGPEFLAVIEGPSGVSWRDVKPPSFRLVYEQLN